MGVVGLRLDDRGRLARDVFTFCHYPIVAGIILFAVAAKKTVAHPGDPLPGAARFALGAGIAVLLLGFGLARYRVIRRIAWERVGAVAGRLSPPSCSTALRRPPSWLVVVALLAIALAVEASRLREVRASVRTGL